MNPFETVEESVPAQQAAPRSPVMASVKARIDALKYDDRYDVVVERGENCYYVTSTVKPLYNSQISIPFFLSLELTIKEIFRLGKVKKVPTRWKSSD